MRHCIFSSDTLCFLEKNVVETLETLIRILPATYFLWDRSRLNVFEHHFARVWQLIFGGTDWMCCALNLYSHIVRDLFFVGQVGGAGL